MERRARAAAGPEALGQRRPSTDTSDAAEPEPRGCDTVPQVPTLDEFLDRLPDHSGEYPTASPLPAGLRRVVDADPRFVAPTLSPTTDLSSAPAITLISAPAAVGKTMLAEELARRLRALLWDVGEFAVGSGTFVGKLSDAHGPRHLGSVLEGVTSGDYCVVIDALDEGYTRARSNSYEEFLRDMASQLVKLKPTRTAVVALGRAETIDLTALILVDEGLEVEHYSVDYFEDDQAREYIDRYLLASGHKAHREHPEPFERARERIFEQVRRAISTQGADSDLAPEAFLGYAPVLSALAGYLTHQNYERLDHELQQTIAELRPGHPNSVWAFLRRLLEGLLSREQGKLRDRLDDGLRARLEAATDVTSLYDAAEQSERLLGPVLGVPVLLPQLPAALSVEYEEGVAGILVEHPFVGQGSLGFASVVFRDYLLAWTLAEGRLELATAVRTLAAGSTFRTSPLLGRFVCEFLADGEEVALNDQDLGLVYESLRSDDGAERVTSLAMDDQPGRLFAEVAIAAGGAVSLVVPATEGAPVRFGRRLSYARLFLEHHSVELGSLGEQLILGPDLLLDAPSVVVRSSDIRIEARQQREPVQILTDSFSGNAPDARVTAFAPESFAIAVNEPLAYPWASYRVPLVTVRANDEELGDALRELGKLMGWFKGDVGGQLSHPVRTMDTLVAKRRVSPALFTYARERGLVVVVGGDYVLRPDEFGINFQQIRLREANDQVREFLEGFIA